MIIPSIDIQKGSTVQLVGGEHKALDAGDPRPWLQRFARVGEVAVIDLDAAMGQGSNQDLVTELCSKQPLRVGGGIRDYPSAKRWLDAGAERIILGTAAEASLLRRLPPDRISVALDARDGKVVVDGWKSATGRALLERLRELRPFTTSFLVTFVEREGRLSGTDMELARKVIQAAGDARVTIAGGVSTTAELAQLDSLGADAQVGMALYTERLSLAEAFCAPLISDRPDGLWPTVICDESGRALGLAYSDRKSVSYALENGIGAYQSRKRGLWIKGQSSGATQELIRIEADCDRDTLRFIVRQAGPGFCHLNQASCWGKARGIDALERSLQSRRVKAPQGSYSARLFQDPVLLAQKLREEAEELSAAKGRREVLFESADLLYFCMVRLAQEGLSMAEVEALLDRRALKVTRRPGDAKPETSQ